ncbi:MAG: hypothetical protein HYS38_03955 [Acidobacteria bacterium]|nr:hypothetical protein [Acidobacteriota bacterium]
MANKSITLEQLPQVLSQLLALARTVDGAKIQNTAGLKYTSLMVCFLLHNMSAAESLLCISKSFGAEWFPVTVGYVVARSMFETDVTAHYISQSPKDRAEQYILFEGVLDKWEMDVCSKHRGSNDPQCKTEMELRWQGRWASKEKEVNAKYDEVRCRFEATSKSGKVKTIRNWSGKTMRQMAIEVAHEEAYDVFYTELSSFTHADVRLANRFLRLRPDGMSWSQRSRKFDVGNVFWHAANFLNCNMELFGKQFGVWEATTIERCWDVETV